MSDRILLVEGANDVGFFSRFCTLANFPDIEISPKKPVDLGENGNGWTHVLSAIPLQLRRLRENDSGLSHLGIVIDADFREVNHGGFDTRYQAISTVLGKHGYSRSTAAGSHQEGFLFEHGDGLPPVGLWIMPDNLADGMLENFVERLIHTPEQQALLAHARSAIDGLPTTLFRPIHTTKALIGTWRAWQKTPNGPLYQSVKDGALDMDSPPARKFQNWLKTTFVQL